MNSSLTMTDMFCGCGGSSTGAKSAHKDLSVRMALNHWKLAIESHSTNHPDTDHDDANLAAVHPRRYPRTTILWASPECTNHSLAKGKQRNNLNQIDIFNADKIDPSEERSRATMWDVVTFAEYHRYDIVVVENVVDVRRWEMWTAWLYAMRCLGYEYEAVYLNSMICHPTPQSRDRLYVVFWRKGIRKPDLDIRPTSYCRFCDKTVEGIQAWRNTNQGRQRWGKYNKQYDYVCPSCTRIVQPVYYSAFNIIDWTIPVQRIGDREKPLKPRTIERIKYGLKKYGNQTMVITTRYSTGVNFRVRNAIVDPLPTQPGDQSHAIAMYSSPFMSAMQYNNQGHSLAEPGQTVVGRDHSFLVAQMPFLSTHYTSNVARGMHEPSTTKATTEHDSLVFPPNMPTPFFAELRGESKVRSTNAALGCVTAGGGHQGLVTHESVHAFLSHYYGNGVNASGLHEPTSVVRTKDSTALIGVPNRDLNVEDCTFRMLMAHETKRAMAFSDSYTVLGTSKEQTKQLGNAVTPPAAREILSRCIAALD